MIARLLRHRGLVATLTRRELAARYRGSLLGFLWSLVNPLLLLAVYTLVFDLVFEPRVAGADPYAVFLVAGLFPWIWLASSLLEATSSLSVNAGLIRKAVFPAEVLPVVSVLANLAHFLLALPILGLAIGVARAFGHPVGGFATLLLPIAILVQLPFVAGLGLGLAALNAHFKDVKDLLANLLTLLFFLTPVLYPLPALAAVPWAGRLVAANPASPFVRLYQELAFYGRIPEPGLWMTAVGLSAIAWGLGSWIFDRLSETLVEAV